MSLESPVHHRPSADGQTRCKACDRLLYRTSRNHWWHVDTEDDACPGAGSGGALTVAIAPPEPG